MGITLKELNGICQKEHYREVGNWMVRHIERPLALYVTWFLVKTPVSANQVTLASIGVAFLGSLLFIPASPWSFLTGVIFFHIWYLLDHVDGQVARYRKSESLSGVYFDFLSHYLVNAFFFFALGTRAYFEQGSGLFLFLTFTAGIGSMMQGIFYDTRYKAIFQRLEKIQTAVWVGYQDPLRKLVQTKVRSDGIKQSLFSALYKTTEIHVALSIVTALAFLGLKWGGFFGVSWVGLAVLYYGIAFPTIVILRCYRHIQDKKIETEFSSLFKS